MGQAMPIERGNWEPRVIKISRKRQITIPAEVYEGAGFADYALASWTEDGLTIQPINVNDEDSSVAILRSLLAQGFDGEELVNEFEKIRSKVVLFDRKVDEAIEDVEQGRTRPFDEVQTELKAKYGL